MQWQNDIASGTWTNSFEEVKAHLKTNPGCVHATDTAGHSCLWIATWKGCVEMCKILLDCSCECCCC